MQTAYRLIILLLLSTCWMSCERSKKHYVDTFTKNRGDFYFIRDTVEQILKRNNKLFRYEVQFTGKRFVEYSYVNDTTQFYFVSDKLSNGMRLKIEDLMYTNDLSLVKVYRDSAKFYFNRCFSYLIIIYETSPVVNDGMKIGNNAYIFERDL